MKKYNIQNYIRYKEDISVSNDDLVTYAVKLMIENKLLNLLVKDSGSIIRAKNILRYYYEKVLE